ERVHRPGDRRRRPARRPPPGQGPRRPADLLRRHLLRQRPGEALRLPHGGGRALPLVPHQPRGDPRHPREGGRPQRPAADPRARQRRPAAELRLAAVGRHLRRARRRCAAHPRARDARRGARGPRAAALPAAPLPVERAVDVRAAARVGAAGHPPPRPGRPGVGPGSSLRPPGAPALPLL
ncbi:MAG: hypothetical protein AVDCRST_MAG30-1503, partial [uncultured Solirubrobacteraceae bacterium]